MIKLGEYAEAGIPHYWIADLEDEVSLRVLRLAGGTYAQAGVFTGEVDLTDPFEVRFDLTVLAGRI